MTYKWHSVTVGGSYHVREGVDSHVRILLRGTAAPSMMFMIDCQHCSCMFCQCHVSPGLLKCNESLQMFSFGCKHHVLLVIFILNISTSFSALIFPYWAFYEQTVIFLNNFGIKINGRQQCIMGNNVSTRRFQPDFRSDFDTVPSILRGKAARSHMTWLFCL